MKKKLLAVAVAGALAAPGVALAQASSVTISGFFHYGVEQLNYSSPTVSPSPRMNTSQMRVFDNGSRLVFKMNEDLGNGLQAIAQLDQRFQADNAWGVQTSSPIGNGSTWVGLKSASLGSLTAGRGDLHWGKVPDGSWAAGASVMNLPSGLTDYIGVTAIANASRTQNVVKWDSPNWGGFNASIAWSANPVGSSEEDMVNTAASGLANTIAAGPITGTAIVSAAGAATPTSSRKGNGWNFNPTYTNGPFMIGYDYWDAKPDAPTAATNDQRGDELWGYYDFGGFRIGLMWNKARLNNAIAGTLVAERTVWSLPIRYVWGPHGIYGSYTRASDIKNAAGSVANTGANQASIAYVYTLSKRTSLSVNYSKLNNDSAINYMLLGSNPYGSQDATPLAGEDQRSISVAMKHTF